MVIKYIPAKSISYGNTRSLSNVKAIVFHYTAGTSDTAENEGIYFKICNTRQAGAHFFVDQNGNIVQSVDIERVAWAVGGNKYSDCAQTGGGKYYGVYTNNNTVSIELCAIVNKAPSQAMIKASAELVAHIQSRCQNAKAIIRHFDVNGKHCPASMMDNSVWNNFLKSIDEARKNIVLYRARVIAKDGLNIRSGPSVNYNITGTKKYNAVCAIIETSGSWGKLKSGKGWVNVSEKYVKKI